MDLCSLLHRLKTNWAIGFLALFLCFVFIPGSDAVTKFGFETEVKEQPVPFMFEDIWFYDRDMTKVVPETNLNWITVVFRSNFLPYASEDAGQATLERLLLDTAKAMAATHEEIIDIFYDRNLADDACFLKLRDGVEVSRLYQLITEFNTNEAVSYTHPTITIKDKTYAFLNAFEMEWKTDVGQEVKERLVNQAEVFFDGTENIYRVNIFKTPFFTPINLLAEDIHVLKVSPYLVELKPSLNAVLTLPINGGNIGDAVPFSLEIFFSDFISIDPSSIANINLKPSELQQELFEVKFEPYDYMEAASQSPIRISGWMKFYTPGELSIPPVTIRYTCSTCSDNQVRSIETKSVNFKVSSIVPSQQTEKSLIIPQDPIEPDYNLETYHKTGTVYLLLSLSSFLFALAGIAWCINKFFALRKEKQYVPEKSKAELLAENVRLLLQEKPSGLHWMYVAGVGKALRAYVVAKYQVASYPQGGSGAVFLETIKHQLPEHLIPLLQILYNTIDEIVALELHPYTELEHFRSEAFEVLHFETM